MKNRILMVILLPVITVAVLVALWATSIWVPPLIGFIQKRTDASLRLVTRLGIEKCENSFNYLLDLRLEDDLRMIASLKQETFSQISALGNHFDKIQLVVLNANGHAITDARGKTSTQPVMIENLDFSGKIVQSFIHNQPVRMVAHYFPFWRWYVVGFIYEKDYLAPLNLARKVIFGGAFAVLLATILTTALTFYLHVNKPLKRIINAAKKVAGGDFKKVAFVGKNEIGLVTKAFNTMVESIETNQHKIHEILTALRESEEMYRVVTENSLSQILLLHKGEVIFANQQVVEDSGYPMSELLGGRKALLFIHPDDRVAVRRLVRKRITGHVKSKPLECRYLTRAGDMRWMEMAVVPTTYQGHLVVLIHGMDITQRKASSNEQQRLEGKLRQAQKMEAIGTLAGGIAHDFNNLLMGIQGNASLLQMDISSEDPNYERVVNIQQYAINGAELTRQLLGYARRGKYEVKPTDINTLISQSSHMFGRTKKEIVIDLDLKPDVWSVEVDRGQIEQVLLNLYINAWQAMAGGGKLFIKTKNLVVDKLDLDDKTKPLKSGRYVCIEITDTGIGISEEAVHKIFDPFFTTKQRERGTGLGLASAYGILHNHGGGIMCKSKVNEGTTFFVYLPKSDNTFESECPASVPVESGSEAILLVDDEQMVIDVGTDMLEYLGYRVLTAESGVDAVEIIKKKGDGIDLIILDMIMPEMGGAETFDAIRKINRTIPVLLCSGYSLDGQASQIMERGCDGFIQKPFTIDVLSQRVRKVLKKRKRTITATG